MVCARDRCACTRQHSILNSSSGRGVLNPRGGRYMALAAVCLALCLVLLTMTRGAHCQEEPPQSQPAAWGAGVAEDWECLRGFAAALGLPLTDAATAAWNCSTSNSSSSANSCWRSGRGEAWRICEWRGVRCDAQRYVTELDLGGAGLQGLLADAVPGAAGAAPAGCSRLGVLKLGGNRVRGGVPPGVCARFPNLTLLDLSHNDLAWAIPSLGGCPGLRELRLEGNALDGGVPEELGALPSLERLNLSCNRLSGPVPDALLLLAGDRPRFMPDSFFLNANLTFSPAYCAAVVAGDGVGASAIGCGSSSSKTDGSGGSRKSSAASTSTTATASTIDTRLVAALIAISVFTTLVLLSVLAKLAQWKAMAASSTGGGGPEGVGGTRIGGSSSNRAASATSSRAAALWSLRDEPVRVMSKKLRTLKPLKLRHLLAATANLSDAYVVGSGGCSTVYRARLPTADDANSDSEASSSGLVAIKLLHLPPAPRLRYHHFPSHKALDRAFRRELEAFLKVRHRNLLKILGCVAHAKVKLLLLEYMPLGSLEQQLYGGANGAGAGDGVGTCTTTAAMDWEQRYRVAAGVAAGLAYLHHDLATPLVHGDLKPSNVLLDADFEPRISDFGMAKLVNPSGAPDAASASLTFGSDAHLGTVGYSAPEKAYSLKPSTKEDVYSFGVLLLELLTRQRPTSSLFGEGVTLSEWVDRALRMPCRSALLQYVLDPALLQQQHTAGPADPDQQQQQQQVVAATCLMLRLGVLCTLPQPAARPDMRTVAKLLHHIKEASAAGTVTVPVEAAGSGRFASVDAILSEEVGRTPFLPTHAHVGTLNFEFSQD